LLILPNTLSFYHLLVQQGLDAYPTRLGPEMAAKGIGSGESPATTPLPASLQFTFADKLFLTRMQTLVAFPIMLSSKSFPTDRAYKRPLIRVSA
jgi:hypothetical protein